MSNPNSRDWVEESNTTKNTSNVYAKLIKEYSKNKLADKDARSDYLKDLESADTSGNLTQEMVEDIQKFAGKDRDGTYDGLTLSANELSVSALKREAWGYFASLANNRRAVKDIYLQEYDVPESTLSVKTDKALSALSESQLEDLLDNERNRKAFLEKQFGAAKMPQEKSISNFLKDMDLNTSYKRVKAGEETQFAEVITKIQEGRQLEDLDIEVLLGSGVYTQKEKQSLIQKFMPSISLAKAKKFWLIENIHANDLKDAYIREADPSLGSWAVREISGNIHDEDILIATSKFTDLKQNTHKIIENPSIFDDFLTDYNQKIRGYRENLEWKEITKSTDFTKMLSSHPKVQGSDNFQLWAIMQITQSQKGESGAMEDVTLYGEITRIGEDGSFDFTEKWHNKFDAALSTKSSETYNSFLSFLTDGNPQKWIASKSMQLFSPTEFDALLSSGKIEEYNGDTLRLKSKSQIEKDISSMTDDINGLKQALKDKEVQMRNDLSEQWYDTWYIKEQIDSDPTIQEYRQKIQELEDKQFEKTQTLDDLESNHFETLKKKINELDPEGEKYGLQKGTSFKTKGGDIYTITHNPSKVGWEIHISSLAGSETASFEDFYRVFKSQDTKRVNIAASDFSTMLDSVKGESSEDSSWKWFSFTDGKLKKENSKVKIPYDYLASKSNEELLKIHDISWDQITVSFWKLKSKAKTEKWELVRWDNEQVVRDETFSIENREYVVSTWFLEEYIHEHSLEPRGLKDNQEVSADQEGVDPMKKKIHFWSAFFHNRATVADAVKGWTLFIEQMKEMIEKWSDEKANQFALKYLWNFLTEDARRDMQSRLEQKQKKSMEDYLERLKTVASDVAIKMIDQWLHDRFAPDYMQEAAVIFMFEKYWVLNAKWLQKYEGKWIWYQALGGKIDDPFFKKIQAEKEDANLPFTEELLVYRFLKVQCGQQWYNGIKRRSKLHKEVKKIRATGKEEEYETGKRDGNDERTVEGRVQWGMNEMGSNNYPNMVGWLEVAVDKGGPMHVMNKIPFIAAFSGVAYNFEEKTTDQLKNFPHHSRLLMMLRFFSHTSDLNLLNETILAVCNTLEKKGDPKHKGIAAKAQALFNDRHNPGEGVRSKLKRTEIFYEEYGEDLTNILYMLNTGKTSDKFNKLIFFEKDNEENPDSGTFKKYYEALHDFVDADTEFTDEGIMSDPFKHKWASGIELHKVTEQLLAMRVWQWSKKEAWPCMWDEVESEFRAIPQRTYDPDPVKNQQMQRKLLEDNLQRFLSGIMRALGSNSRELSGYNALTWPFTRLNTWGIDMTKFEKAEGFNVHDLLKHPSGDTKKLVQKFAQNIIDVEVHGKNFSHEITGREESESSSTTIWNSVRDKVVTNIEEDKNRGPDLIDEWYPEGR